jgi:hypothetical protein
MTWWLIIGIHQKHILTSFGYSFNVEHLGMLKNHSSDILSIRFKHTRILRIFGLFYKYFKIIYTKANFQAYLFL